MQHNDKFILSRRGFLGLAGVTLAISALPPAFAQAASDPTQLFNRIRKAHGLPLMATDARLEEAALYQARRMASHGKISHSVGWGNGFVARLKKAGIRGPAAENLASGQSDTDAAFDAWMQSPGHRKNMLDPTFAHYGLAWATPEDKPRYIYWAMVLGL
ncbi:CAP domain-containing protein [Falsochrobactrum shanghaiense]|uniref:CAP domain-containing protein n=1 Tax=Falsochrobactrum shanghaiense TaxID=2201899 RepID=A0A316JBG0_9HYPH|nr:CAP domain-containing protein [Falsochrobactrum shanghaiense]PWL19212.1 CAP domain-containing protein [Falsochrobactrum shanghaiense]